MLGQLGKSSKLQLHLQIYSRDYNNNPSTGLPNVSFSDPSIQAAIQQAPDAALVTYIPASPGILTIYINFTAPGRARTGETLLSGHRIALARVFRVCSCCCLSACESLAETCAEGWNSCVSLGQSIGKLLFPLLRRK